MEQQFMLLFKLLQQIWDNQVQLFLEDGIYMTDMLDYAGCYTYENGS